MAEKILYILGAGASAQCLPISKTVKDNEDKTLYGLADKPEGVSPFSCIRAIASDPEKRGAKEGSGKIISN